MQNWKPMLNTLTTKTYLNLPKLNRSHLVEQIFKNLPKLTWQSFLQLISTDPALPTAQTATVTHISNLNV